MRMKAEDEEWQLAQYFKLHLHPVTMRTRDRITADPLPAGKQVDDVYADFFAYLLKHTERFFKDHQVDGDSLWQSYGPKVDFVIAHPNGWGTHEQSTLRKAAVKGGLVPEDSAKQRIHFVSEGEASVHFVMFYSDLEPQIHVCATYLFILPPFK
jgi:hypothetical protein